MYTTYRMYYVNSHEQFGTGAEGWRGVRFESKHWPIAEGPTRMYPRH